MAHPLDGVRAKLARAQEHLDAVAILERKLRDSTGNPIVREKSADGNFISFVLRLPTPDPRMTLLIGDCIHNARASLDHLVYALAERGPIPRTENLRVKGMFPICLSEHGNFSHFEKQISKGRLNNVPSAAVALIKTFQPTDRGDSLWVLNHLENIDKHRRLTLATILVPDYDIQVGPIGLSTKFGKYRERLARGSSYL